MIILHPYRFCGRSWLAFLALSCMMTTLKGGYQACSSLSHCRITVAGQTMMLGLNRPLRCKPARKAASWMVLPKPISSPMMPPALCVCSSHSHFTPGGKAAIHMGKPGLLASYTFEQSPSQPLEKTRKKKFTPFTNHTGSLLRQQPGAPHSLLTCQSMHQAVW